MDVGHVKFFSRIYNVVIRIAKSQGPSHLGEALVEVEHGGIVEQNNLQNQAASG